MIKLRFERCALLSDVKAMTMTASSLHEYREKVTTWMFQEKVLCREDGNPAENSGSLASIFFHRLDG